MQDDSLLDALRIPITVIEDEPSVNISERNAPRSPLIDPMSPNVSDFDMLSGGQTLSFAPFMREYTFGTVESFKSSEKSSVHLSQIPHIAAVMGDSYYYTVERNEYPGSDGEVSPASPSNPNQGLIEVKMREKGPLDRIEDLNDSRPLLEMRKALLRIKAGIRITCKLIINLFAFELFILFVILANTVVLALEDPTEEDQDETLVALDTFFLSVYTVEALLKIGGLGLIRKKGAYLRDSANVMDFGIVVAGWVERIAQEGYNLSAFRILRVLRPLRSISSIEGLRVLIISLISSFKPLMFAILVFLFFLCIFAIAGLQLWMGLFRFRCVDISTGQTYSEDDICGNFECPVGSECGETLDNPNYGMTNFDNILYAFLAVFQCVTLEGWTHIMILSEKAMSIFVVFFYVPLVFIGAFLMLNFILAVIKYHFTKAMDVERAAKKAKANEEEELNSSLIQATSIKVVPEEAKEVPRPRLIREDFDRDMSMFSVSNISRLQADSERPQDSFIRTPTLARSLTLKSSGIIRDYGKGKTQEILLSLIKSHGGIVKLKKDTAIRLKNNLDFEDFAYSIPEDIKVTSSSTTDVKPPLQGIERLKRFLMSENEYNFVYLLEGQVDEIRSDRSAQFREILNKYCLSTFEVFSYLALQTSRSAAYEMVVGTAKEEVSDTVERDRITQQVKGEWSGEDVTGFSHQLPKQLSSMKYRLWPPGFCGKYHKLQFVVYALVANKLFTNSMLVAVILNTVVLSMDHYGIDEDMANALLMMNVIFNVIFIIEMLLKLVGLGVIGYFRDPMNYLDAAVVIISAVELIFLSQNSALTAFRTVRIFRTFRVLRVLRVARLFRYMNSMSAILRVLSSSIYSCISLAMLLVLFIFVFALVGMQIFGGKLEGSSRANFDSFHAAFVTVFQILSMEDWQTVLYDAMRSVGKASCLYFIIWIFLGNFMVLNLFLAILLDSFDQYEDNEDVDSLPEVQEFQETHDTEEHKQRRRRSSLFGEAVDLKRKKKEEESVKQLERFHTERIVEYTDMFHEIECKRSYYLFSKNSKIRIACYRMANSSVFENLVLVIIVLSSIKLVWDTYLLEEPEDSDSVKTSEYLDIGFTCIFALEFIIKSISSGFIADKNTYLRESWNQLDFGIVVVSIIELSVQSFNVPFIKVIRLLRTLRPLRFISHNLSMKLVVTALLESLCAIVNVVIVLLIVWLMFAILGVSLFSGKFYACEVPSVEKETLCNQYGFEWVNADSHFDNVYEALITLFIVSSLEGWPSIMYQAVDAHDEGLAPSKDYNPAAAYYFIVFIFIGSFFFVNLFIGVVFMQFNEAKKNESSAYSLVLNKNQMRWVEIQSLIPKAKPQLEESKKTHSKFRLFFYALSKHFAFDMFILVCILLNMLQMAMAYYQGSEDYVFALEMINLTFTIIFIFEALIKLTGQGIRGYFHRHWNKFDFFVVTASILDLTMSVFLGSDQSMLRTAPQLVRVIRVLRVSRLIRVFKSLKPLQDLVMVMAVSLPAILNVISLLLLIFFIYSILGSFMFFDLSFGDLIDRHTNFTNFGKAMISLLRISTGENWNLIMHDVGRERGEWISLLYFASFITITTFIMLNLFVMVIVQSYQEYKNNPKNPHQVFHADLKIIKHVWGIYASHRIRAEVRELPKMMRKIGVEDKKLGVPAEYPYNKIVSILSSMDLHIDEDGFVYFHDFLFALLKRRHFKQPKNPNMLSKQIIKNNNMKITEKLTDLREKGKNSVRQTVGSDGKRDFLVTMFYAKTVFRAWKNWALYRGPADDPDTPRSYSKIYPGNNTPGSDSD